jgi:DNA-binding MarR family transcriptional regulator
VLFDVWLVSRATTGLLDDALSSTGLTADEFGVYSVLSAGPMTPTELARWMAAPTTTVSSYIKRLQGRGHLVRERNPEDGRSYVLRLTPAGRRAHRAGVNAFVPVLTGVVGALGSREQAVRDALQLLRASVTALMTPASSRVGR